MKRSAPEPLIKPSKRQKSEDVIEEVATFQDAHPYPCDALVVGIDFTIPVHGLFISEKSKSLHVILTQPSNEGGLRTWNLDESVTKNCAIQFLKILYPKMKADFDSLKDGELRPFMTLVMAHIEDNPKEKLQSYVIHFGRSCIFQFGVGHKMPSILSSYVSKEKVQRAFYLAQILNDFDIQLSYDFAGEGGNFKYRRFLGILFSAMFHGMYSPIMWTHWKKHIEGSFVPSTIHWVLLLRVYEILKLRGDWIHDTLLHLINMSDEIRIDCLRKFFHSFDIIRSQNNFDPELVLMVQDMILKICLIKL